jgi:hypothetical protein
MDGLRNGEDIYEALRSMLSNCADLRLPAGCIWCYIRAWPAAKTELCSCLAGQER